VADAALFVSDVGSEGIVEAGIASVAGCSASWVDADLEVRKRRLSEPQSSVGVVVVTYTVDIPATAVNQASRYHDSLINAVANDFTDALSAEVSRANFQYTPEVVSVVTPVIRIAPESSSSSLASSCATWLITCCALAFAFLRQDWN